MKPNAVSDTRHFWNWEEKTETEPRSLFLYGNIAEESWWDDDITPQMFRDELFADEGDIVVWINSPGGDCIAASQIYTMLMEYKGNVTIKVDGIAASAASVIAMAGTEVLMAPTAVMMIHNPLTVAWGDASEMQKAIALLDEVKESIINAYEIRTGLSRTKISHMMDSETWMSAKTAIENGFADGMLYSSDKEPVAQNSFMFSRKLATASLFNKLNLKNEDENKDDTEKKATEEPTQTTVTESIPVAENTTTKADAGVPKEQLVHRLNLLKI